MADLSDRTLGGNTVLDLALRLGVRSQVILETLSSLGLEIDDPTASLDPQVEEAVVDRMVESGQVAKRAAKAAQKRRSVEEPLADDTILKEALGASQTGYSEKAIPQQVAHRMGEEKPSLLERLGLRRPRHPAEPDLSAEALDTRAEIPQPPAPTEVSVPPPEKPPSFEPLSTPSAASEPVPEQEPEALDEEEMGLDFDLADLSDEEGLVEEEAPTEAEAPLEGEADLDLDLESLEPEEPASEPETEPEPEGEAEPEPEVAEETLPPAGEAQPEEVEAEEDLGEDLDIGDLDLGGEGEEKELPEGEEDALEDLLIDESDESLLEGLDDLDLGDFTGAPEEEEEEAPAEPEGEEAAEEAEEAAEAAEEEEEAEEEGEAEEEEERPPGLVERIILKLNLSPVEIIAAAVGSLVVMLTALGLTMVYYLNYSPRKALDLWDKGYRAYQSEVLNDARFNTIVDSFTRLLTDFPYDSHLEEAAYLLAKSFYRRAEEVAKTDPSAAKPLYADTVVYFRKFLREQRRIGDRLAEKSGQGYRRYMNPEWEEEAYYYIALAYEKQREFQHALDAYEAFLKEYPKSDRVSQVRITVGDIWRQWANVDESFRAKRLAQAIKKYEEALADPRTDNQTRIALHTNIGDIDRRLYDTTKEQYRQGYIQATLREYRNAERLLLGGDRKSVEHHTLERNLALGLADTLLILGKNAAADVRLVTEAARNFDRSAPLRASQQAAANVLRATANRYLSEAVYWYSKLIQTKPGVQFTPQKIAGTTGEILDGPDAPLLTNEQKIHVQNNLAEAYFYMGLYDQAIATARPLIDDLYTRDRNNPYLASLCYLVGDAAWQEGDYGGLVIQYYKKGREIDPLFPAGSGTRSNVAALRMANTYYKRGMEEGNPRDLKSAIEEYGLILRQFPGTKWTYFTHYWLARTRERYADVLSDPKSPYYSPEKAKTNYDLAALEYQTAKGVRTNAVWLDKRNRDALKDCYFRPGRCAYRAGDLSKARKLLAEAILWSATGAPGDPRAIPCRELLGDIYLDLGHPDQAIRIYKHYLAKKYDQQDSRGDSLSRVSLKLARAYLRRFSYGQARDVLQRIVRDNPVVHRPGSAEVEEGPGLEAQRLIAQSYRDEADVSFDEMRQDKLRSAATAYRTLLKMNPGEHSALRALAEISFDLAGPKHPEYYQQAADYYKQFVDSGAADLEKDRDMVYYRWGDCYYRMADYTNAAAAMKKINGASIPPDTRAQAFLVLGDCYEKLSGQQTDKIAKQYYLTMAKETYLNAIQTKNRFASEVARNKLTLISMR